MTRYLHTMYRITDPEKSRAFYEALGLEFRNEMDIVRNGEKEATNYFFGVPGQEEELELTFNHDGRTYDLGTGYGHIALAVDDLGAALTRLKAQGIEAERDDAAVLRVGHQDRLCGMTGRGGQVPPAGSGRCAHRLTQRSYFPLRSINSMR